MKREYKLLEKCHLAADTLLRPTILAKDQGHFVVKRTCFTIAYVSQHSSLSQTAYIEIPVYV